MKPDTLWKSSELKDFMCGSVDLERSTGRMMGIVSAGTRASMSGMMGDGVWSVASKVSGWYGV